MGSKLGAYVQKPEYVEMVAKESWKFGREKFIPIGMKYFEDHPEDVQIIKTNLERFGLDTSPASMQKILEETVVHYYEKLFILSKQYEAYWIIKNRIEVGNQLDPIKEALNQGKGVFLGQSHFGVTYFLPSVFMANDLDIISVGYFPEPVGSLLVKNTSEFAQKYNTGKLSMINIADPSVSPPIAMLQALNQRKLIMNVFDENNPLCKKVKLFGKELRGGTGMDQILNNFNDDQIAVFTPFLIRTSNENFRLEVEQHSLSTPDIIQSFFNSLEKRVRQYPEQWYFIQEVHENME